MAPVMDASAQLPSKCHRSLYRMSLSPIPPKIQISPLKTALPIQRLADQSGIELVQVVPLSVDFNTSLVLPVAVSPPKRYMFPSNETKSAALLAVSPAVGVTCAQYRPVSSIVEVVELEVDELLDDELLELEDELDESELEVLSDEVLVFDELVLVELEELLDELTELLVVAGLFFVPQPKEIYRAIINAAKRNTLNVVFIVSSN